MTEAEDDGDNCEEHDGAPLDHTFVGTFEGEFCFDYACLLLFETKKVLELFFS